jgi:hypothetical protein
MAEFHVNLGGADLHQPRGVSPTPLTLPDNENFAYLVEDFSGDSLFVLNTSTGDQKVFFGGSQAGASLASLTYTFFIRDEDAESFLITDDGSPAKDQISINTVGGSERISFGNSTTSPHYRFLGSNDVRLESCRLRMANNSIATPVSGQGFLYVKDVAGLSELFYHDDSAIETQITGALGLGGGGIPHSVAGDENVIVENSGTSRAWLTAHITDDAIEIGNASDFDGPRLQFGDFSALYIGRSPAGVVPGSGSVTVIGNTANISAITSAVGVGSSVRLTGSQSVAVGHAARAATNDVALGWNAVLTGSQSAHVGFGCVGASAGFTSGIGGNLNYNARDHVILLGHSAAAASVDGAMYVGANETHRISLFMFGTGSAGDTVLDARVTLTTSPKLTDADSSNGWIFSGGGSTGLGGSTIEIHCAPTGFASATVQHAAQRVSHFEAVGTLGNPVEFGLHIGDEGVVNSSNANLYFEAGDGAGAVQASFSFVGLTDDLTLSLPTGGEFQITDRKTLLTQNATDATVLEVLMRDEDAVVPALLLSTNAADDFTDDLTAMRIDLSTANTLTSGVQVTGIDLRGQTNLGAGASVAINVGSGWDFGLFVSSGQVALVPTGNYSLTMTGAANITARTILADDTPGAFRISHTPGGFVYVEIDTDDGSEAMRLGSAGNPDLEIGAATNQLIGFHGLTPTAISAAYTRTATAVPDRVLLASASATTINNNNVLAAIILDLQNKGLLG